MKRAFVTAITGQDGSYLAELLRSKDYEVHGLIRRSSSFNTARIDHLLRWTPRVTFRELVRMTMESDLRLARRELAVEQDGLGEKETLP